MHVDLFRMIKNQFHFPQCSAKKTVLKFMELQTFNYFVVKYLIAQSYYLVPENVMFLALIVKSGIFAYLGLKWTF